MPSSPMLTNYLKKTCNTYFVCLDASNQLSHFHGDIWRLIIFSYSCEKNNEMCMHLINDMRIMHRVYLGISQNFLLLGFIRAFIPFTQHIVCCHWRTCLYVRHWILWKTVHFLFVYFIVFFIVFFSVCCNSDPPWG